jgi:riboflavin biosynthesis pyrimidine reductase
MAEQPVFAIVSSRLELDQSSHIFTDAPVTPVIVTTSKATGTGRFDAVADVLVAGDGDHVDVGTMIAGLHNRGLVNILCEGGPTLFGSLLAADAVDELSLTVSPSLEGGDAPRITAGQMPARSLTLKQVLKSGDDLLLNYARSRATDSA